jgi:hypothetical protein
MAMNKSEQEFYNRALETGKMYERMYSEEYNKMQDLKSYLRVRKLMLECNENLTDEEEVVVEVCEEILKYLDK